jgi:hypothetical protein
MIALILPIDDAIVMKLDTLGVLQWITQLGSFTGPGDNSGSDLCNSIDIDLSGNLYCAGTTTGNISETNGGSIDIFIMKLTNNGVLNWITQLGSLTGKESNAGIDYCFDVLVDNLGNILCAGNTNSAVGEANSGGTDALVIKLNKNGNL